MITRQHRNSDTSFETSGAKRWQNLVSFQMKNDCFENNPEPIAVEIYSVIVL